MEPLRSELSAQPARLGPDAVRTVRRASDLRGVFADGAALEELIRAGDPVVYETYEPPIPNPRGHLVYGLTVLYPGRVGDEYFMTRGHYHFQRLTAEVYVPLRGEGYLLLQDEAGHARAEALLPGSVMYVPPGWAHRSVNTGDGPLVFLYVYPADAGHDYETISRVGFRIRVLATDAGPQVVPVGRGSGCRSTPPSDPAAQGPVGSRGVAGAPPGGPRGGFSPPSTPFGPRPPGCAPRCAG